ncbi:hypothetical protein [Pararhodobacter aggregans]|uniref:hypothetical protein n=1 Tax=Pararhodobacter aggregans TaxID=404875 RepID=UPI003A8DB23D
MSDQAKKIQVMERYERAAHRVQTAIWAFPEHENRSPKHLRVGVDMSKPDMAGLAGLLIAKGVISELEYLEAIAVAAEGEAEAYENELAARFGINIRTV